MHATILFALLAVSGTNGHLSLQQENAAAVSTEGADCSGCQQGCSSCGRGKERISMAAKLANIGANPRGGVMGNMPQTCYQPPYGCYAATRYNHRYPAFHGWYYRDSYNYRNYFDYPWHAEMHEPTSYFSYNTEGSVPTRSPLPAHAKGQPQARQPQNYARAPQPAVRPQPIPAQPAVAPLAPVTSGVPRPTPLRATPVATQNWAPVLDVGR